MQAVMLASKNKFYFSCKIKENIDNDTGQIQTFDKFNEIIK